MKTREDLITNGILKPHNMDTYLEAYELFENGEDMVGITQATGTGKTYLLAQFLYDFCYRLKAKGFETDKSPAKPIRALLLSPTTHLSHQTAKKLFGVVGTNMKNVTATTYTELLYATDEDLAQHFDVIVLDEFHRLGAKKWGPAVQKLLNANPSAKVLGLTATPVRFLDEARDMGEELFNGVVVQGPNIGQAINSGILPKPKYVLGLYSYEHAFEDLQSAIDKCKDPERKTKLEHLLAIAKREAVNMESLEDIIARNINEAEQTQGGGFVDGKYIAYCSDIEHSKEVIAQLPKLLSSTNQEVHIYTVNYTLGKEANQQQIDAFENDTSGAIKVMVAINMFDEGFHLNEVKGVFCFSNTTSPARHLQRIGRTLDAENINHQPLIFDMVNNISCLKDFGKSCSAHSSEELDEVDSDEYVSPFKDLPFDIDEKSLTLAEMLSKLDFAIPERLTPEQWIELFEEYFKQNPNATSIPTSNHTLYVKMDHLKAAFNNGHGKLSAGEQKIIDWFIDTGRADFLKKENKEDITLTPEQWIEAFETFFNENPNATYIPRSIPIFGTKIDTLKKAYNNGQGRPSAGVQKIIDWFINTGRANFLKKENKEDRELTPEQWIEAFETFFNENPNATSIPQSTPIVGSKFHQLKLAYNNGQGKLSAGEQKIINWFIDTGREDFLKKENKKGITLTPEQWIEAFETFFNENPNATSIPTSSTNLSTKMKNLKKAYNNGHGKPSYNEQIIIDWFINTGREDFLKKENKEYRELTPEQWIEAFETFFKENPNATSIPTSNPTLKSKMNNLKDAYNNGQGKLSAGEQKIINWFIDTGRADFLKKENKEDITLTPEQWIELFEQYFKANPNATYIPKSNHTIYAKMNNLKAAYNNGHGKPSVGNQKIIDWFIATGRGNMLLTKKINKKGGAVGGDDDQTM